jgi:AraC-like DNA-binding protein
MTIKMTSENVAAPDREAAMLSAICDTVVRVEIEHRDDRPAGDIDYELEVSTLGKIVMFSAKSSPVTVNRTPRLAREDAAPQIVVGLQVAGSSAMVQNGRYAALHRGEFAIWDTSRPYTLFFDQGANQQFFRIPRAALAMPEPAIRALTGTTLGRSTPIARFVSSHFTRIARTPELQTGGAGTVLAEPTIDLLRGMLSAEVGDSQRALAAADATLEMRMLDYMTRHLADPGLTVESVARAHHISVRYLYVVLGRSGISPADWIRRHRLEACRRELARPGADSQTIADIARMWGFPNAHSFGRMFKSAFGLSPREWRATRAG